MSSPFIIALSARSPSPSFSVPLPLRRRVRLHPRPPRFPSSSSVRLLHPPHPASGRGQRASRRQTTDDRWAPRDYSAGLEGPDGEGGTAGAVRPGLGRGGRGTVLTSGEPPTTPGPSWRVGPRRGRGGSRSPPLPGPRGGQG